jgi:ubiquinone/menaquinone biosynthesis C-methylase UbiE
VSSTQHEINLHFERAAGYWRDLYTRDDVSSRVYRDRQAAILRIVDELSLPHGERILEAGCGAGRMALALAARGYRVDAVDSVQRMVDIARAFADENDAGHLVKTRLADVSRLPFGENEFNLAVAVGLTPWVPSLAVTLGELRRVLRAGGHLVITADNRIALTRLLDPVARISQAGGALLAFLGLRSRSPVARMYAPARFDKSLRNAGFEILASETAGFGPVTLARCSFIPDGAGLRINRILQASADRKTPVIRSLGRQYIVLSRKVR